MSGPLVVAGPGLRGVADFIEDVEGQRLLDCEVHLGDDLDMHLVLAEGLTARGGGFDNHAAPLARFTCFKTTDNVVT